MDITVGSLFAGVGGFDLGMEQAGMRPAWQVEIDPHARAVDWIHRQRLAAQDG